jgi:hypothetical protein
LPVEHLEMEGVLVAVVYAALVAHRSGQLEIELGPGRARDGRAGEWRTALLAKTVLGPVRCAARRARQGCLTVHVHVPD